MHGLSLKLFFQYLFQYPSLISTLLIAPCIGVVNQLSVPFVLKHLVNAIYQQNNLHHLIILFIFVWTISKLIIRLQVYYSAFQTPHLIALFRKKVIDYYLIQPTLINKTHQSMEIGKIANDLANTIERIWGLCVWNIIPNTLSFLIVLYQIAKINGTIMINLACYFFLQLILIGKAFSLIQKNASKHRASNMALLSTIHDTFKNPLNLIVYPSKSYFDDSIRGDQLHESMCRQQLIHTVNHLRLKVDCLGVMMLVINFFILLKHRVSFDLGEMTFIALTSISMIEILWQLGHCATELNKEIGLFQKLSKYLVSIPRFPTKNVGIKHGSVIVNNLSFAYPNQSDVFNNTSFEIPGDTVTLIRSESGYGKTTLLYLMLGLLKPQKGSIHVDDLSLSHLNPPQIRQLINVVPQHTQILNRSIMDNLMIAKPKASMKELLHSLSLAKCDQFISTLHSGIHTNANQLSGGQKQQLSIARAFLKQSPIWVIDEGLTGVDLKTYSSIMHNVVNRRPFKSLIIMSHHQRDSRFATKIVDLNDCN